MGLVVNDDIMSTLYGLEIFAEQVDKVREGFLTTPAQLSEEMQKKQQQIREIQAEIAQLQIENKELKRKNAE